MRRSLPARTPCPADARRADACLQGADGSRERMSEAEAVIVPSGERRPCRFAVRGAPNAVTLSFDVFFGIGK